MASVKRRRTDDEIDESVSPSSITNANTKANGNAESRVPKVSRKIHACTECQARKIKCDLEAPNRASCTRCSKKGLKCVVNKSLQSLLEEDTTWKTNLEQNNQNLTLAVSKILRVLNLPDLESFTSQLNPGQAISESVGNVPPARKDALSTPTRPAGMAMTRDNSREPEQGRSNDAIVTDPMGALYEVTKLRNLRLGSSGRILPPRQTTLEHDFISKGAISVADAEELFRVFNTSLNHYLWAGVALVHDNLTSVRRSSSLLTAAITTVTALHIPGNEKTFGICYAEFTNLVCDSMFARYHSLDEIRALAIGAFWLSDVSWNLSGHAVRIATELNLHQNYSRAIRGSREHFEGARLWYFLYVCDHHFSIAYGRPPVIQEDISIINHEKFLELPGILQSDVRLHSQVAVFIILTRFYNTFGPDIEQMVTEADLTHLQQFGSALDSWSSKWSIRLTPNAYVATYPAKGVSLHHFFGKLQVTSVSLRGIANMLELSPQRRDLANTAISCAMSILQMSLGDPDLRNSVIGVPIYLHTMIAYSAVFLLKARQRSKTYNLEADSELILDLVTRIINLLQRSRSQAGERHLSGHIATGLQKMLDRMTSREASEKPGAVPLTNPEGMGADYLQHPDGQMWGDHHYFGAPESGILRMFDESVPFSDEHFFPLGFFDLISAPQPEMGYQ